MRPGNFGAEISGRKNSEAPIIFWPKYEADGVEVGEVEGAADLEINRRVSIVEADAVIHQGFRAQQSGGRNAGSLFEKRHSIFPKIDGNHTREINRSELHSIQAH